MLVEEAATLLSAQNPQHPNKKREIAAAQSGMQSSEVSRQPRVGLAMCSFIHSFVLPSSVQWTRAEAYYGPANSVGC